MKKSISLLAIAAITAFTMNINAQSIKASGKSQEGIKTEQTCSEQKCDKADKKGKPGKFDKARKGDKMRKGNKQRPDSMAAFKGITLTQDQQQKIQQIRADFRAQRQAKAAVKGQKMERKEISPEQRDSLRNARMQVRLDYLHQIQKVLTPEQYITFLENTAVMKNVAPQGGKHITKGPRPDQKKDRKGPRGMNRDRQAPQQQS